jgi:hypothetical protein
VTVFFALLVCALIVWQIRDELRPDEPQQVHWTSPVDDEWIECPLPRGWSTDDVWVTLAAIGQLPEVARV